MAAFYAVRKGRKTGVFTDPQEVTAALHGFAGFDCRKFRTLGEAQAYLSGDSSSSPADETSPYAYVDGSYLATRRAVGWGCVLHSGAKDSPLVKISGAREARHPECGSHEAELLAILRAMQYAKEHGWKTLTVHTDQKEAQAWATGEHRKAVFQSFRARFATLSSHVSVTFKWVRSHADDANHNQADKLASKAAGKFKPGLREDAVLAVSVDQLRELIEEAVRAALRPSAPASRTSPRGNLTASDPVCDLCAGGSQPTRQMSRV